MALYNSHKYTVAVPYIISGYIREYDISKANINILYNAGHLTIEQYNYYMTCDRMVRQKDIGIMQKNKKVNKDLKDGIINAKKMFFEANNINDNNVVSIKNDAVFLLNTIPGVTKFGNIEFVNKNIYTSFYKLANLELYYYFDSVNNIEKLDIKGIGDNDLLVHENYFLEFLKVVFASAQTESVDDTLDIIINFYDSYINRSLNVEYYRTFNSEGVFKVNIESMMYSYNAYFVDQSDIQHIDISYNMNIIRQLYSYFSNIKSLTRKNRL